MERLLLRGMSMRSRAFTFEELSAMDARIQPVIDAAQSKPATPANIVDVKPILEDDSKREAASPQSASEQVAEGKRPSWRDSASL